MRKSVIYFLLLFVTTFGLKAQTTKTVGASGADYTTLADAFIDINNGVITGDIILQIIDNCDEYTTAELFESGYSGTADYTSVLIYPASSGWQISGDFDGPLISLNGADNVTFDGRVNQSGGKDLVITNTNTGTSASTIQFSESASNNLVKFCVIKGSGTGTGPGPGIIFFSTATTGSGNDGNTIDNNDITADAAGRPVAAVFSSGTSGNENSGNVISNNNIFDFLMHGTASYGIYISTYSTAFTISGNSFYESASFAPSAVVNYNIIYINNTTGTGFTVSGNFIGGQSPSCGGSPWTKTSASNNLFNAIYLNVGTGSPSSIQNNTIQNFSWSNSSSGAWTAINIAGGTVDIGTVTGNTIGASTGTGSITVTGGTNGLNVTGINISSTGTIDCRNNIIGSVTTATSLATLACNFTGINKTAGAGTATINNNNIGSTSTAGSINASSSSTANSQTVIGINNLGSGSITINGNTIANLTNSSSRTSTSDRSRTTGIISTAGSLTCSNNTIRDLAAASANDAINHLASVCGIGLTGITTDKTVSGNTIYNLSNSYSTFTGCLSGIYFIGSTGSNIVSGNFIRSLSVTGGSSTTAKIYGINISSGVTTYYNNIISLGGSSLTDIFGIYETGAVNNNNSIYYNTVYIGGNVSSGTNKSYALYSAATTNTRNFRNNLFTNARSTTGGSGLHYAMYIVSSGGTLTCDYNDYRATGTGGMLGYYGADVSSLPIVTGQDVSSFAINPGYSNPGGTNASDYLASAATLVAVTGTGITTDYDGGAARSSTYPSMGAFEYTVAPGAWTWTGTTDTDWNTASNWNYTTVPPASGNAIIANVTNKPVVNQSLASPAECQDLTINSGSVLTIAAGRALKVNGTLTNNAGNSGLVIKSDASGDGVLLNNTASVPGTVELYLTGGTGTYGPRFHYIVPPVASMTIGTTPTIAETKAALGLTNFNGDLVSYSESAAGGNKDAGWQYFDGYNSTTPFTSMVSSQGYNIYLTAGDMMTFTGNMNAPAHTFSSLSYTNLGWNLIGNPYPCNFDLSGVTALTNSDNVDNTVYFNNDGRYAFWNVDLGTGTTGFSSIVAPMQGFFVHVTAAGQSVTLPVSSKTTSAASPLRAKGSGIVKKVKLVLDNNIRSDETIVCLVDNAKSGFDSDYDAFKLFGSSATAPYIYSEVNSVKYALNSIPDPGSSTVVIPLTVVLKASGTYSIKITEFDNLENMTVSLKHGSNVIQVSENSKYTFTSSSAAAYTDFQLIFGNLITGDETEIMDELKIWYSNSMLNIQCGNGTPTGNGRITIYDIQGKPVYTEDKVYLTPGQTYQYSPGLKQGLYILNIVGAGKPFTRRFVVY